MKIERIEVIALNKSHKLEHLTLTITHERGIPTVEYLGERYCIPLDRIFEDLTNKNKLTVILNSQPSQIVITPEHEYSAFDYMDNDERFK